VQQHADGFEGFSFAAAEQLLPVKTKQAVLGVFAAVECGLARITQRGGSV
jgi:hypothetical protein